MNQVFAPGCALMLYKPHLADKVQRALNQEGGADARHLKCCRHAPGLPPGTQVINVCPGCDRRYRSLYEGVSTRSLWEVLAESSSFPFPDHGGRAMAIQDACPTRDQARVLDAVRTLLEKMNVRIVEPKATRGRGNAGGGSGRLLRLLREVHGHRRPETPIPGGSPLRRRDGPREPRS